MLKSLQKSFQERLPAGLSDTANARLERTLRHYVQEVIRKTGMMDEQEILRESFDSMASWFRRNTAQISYPTVVDEPESPPLLKAVSAPAVVPLRQAPAPAPATATATATAWQPKDFLQPQEQVVKYRETEHNLLLNSKDRNWLMNSAENRYNFSIQLGGSSIPQAKGPQPTIQVRFRNITRIEFIKTIMPIEGLHVAVPRAIDPVSKAVIAAPEQAFLSSLSYPFVHVTMDELQGNNVGTNEQIDQSLAICQFDAMWKSDHYASERQINRGYTLFFPKFMKAQRVYAPSPLASLQKMSFKLLNPEGTLLSDAPDSIAIQHVIYSSQTTGSILYSEPAATASTAAYLFLQTSEWFHLWTFSKLDRLLIGGLDTIAGQEPTSIEFNNWLQYADGHTIVGIAHGATRATLVDGANDCGYANWIIIRNRFVNPESTGDCSRYLFAGAAGETAFANALTAHLYSGAGALNLNRQVQLTLRIVTRELDSASNVRPDNI